MPRPQRRIARASMLPSGRGRKPSVAAAHPYPAQHLTAVRPSGWPTRPRPALKLNTRPSDPPAALRGSPERCRSPPSAGQEAGLPALSGATALHSRQPIWASAAPHRAGCDAYEPFRRASGRQACAATSRTSTSSCHCVGNDRSRLLAHSVGGVLGFEDDHRKSGVVLHGPVPSYEPWSLRHPGHKLLMQRAFGSHSVVDGHVDDDCVHAVSLRLSRGGTIHISGGNRCWMRSNW